MECPICENPVTHRVWESRTLYERGMPPKFIGCTHCNRMVRT